MAKVRYNQPRLFRMGGTKLLPGLNTVADDVWDAMRRNPVVAQKIERGVIVEMKRDKPGRPSAADIVAEIKDTYRVDVLREYVKDARQTVQDAAQAQIAKIDAMAKQPDEG